MDKSFGIRDKFKVKNIYIFCPTVKVDPAWEEMINDFKQRSVRDDEFVESEQVFSSDLEQSLSTVYDQLVEDSLENKHTKKQVEPKLIIIDDCLLELDYSTSHS